MSRVSAGLRDDFDRRDQEFEDSNPRTASNDDVPLRATVTESGNEISCSIQETNRLRAQLGLKPLQIETKEDIATAQRRRAAEAEKAQAEQEADSIRSYLEKRRRERELNKKVDGVSLGEELADTSASGGAMDWVQRSRLVEQQRVAEANAKARAAQSKPKQASYSSAALAGIRIRHGASELTGTDELAEEGVVLTLKDERIIDADTGDVNVAEDELENIDLVEKAKTKRNNDLRAKRPMHNNYGGDAFADEASNELLPQYHDEKETEKARALKNSIRIGSGGAVDDQDEHQAAVKARLAAATAQGKTVYSFDSSSASVDSSLRFQRAFMTEEEAEELKRQQQPVEFKKKTKKKVAVRRKAEDAADDEVIEGSTFVLPEPSAEEQSADRGSRDRSRKVAAEEAAAAELNSRREHHYAAAREKADDQIDALKEEYLREQLIKRQEQREAMLQAAKEQATMDVVEPLVMPALESVKAEPISFEDDGDAEMREALARVKRLEQSRNTAGTFSAPTRRTDAGAAVFARLQALSGQNLPSAQPQGQVWTSTKEFVTGIRTAATFSGTRMDEEEPAATSTHGTTSTAPVIVPLVQLSRPGVAAADSRGAWKADEHAGDAEMTESQEIPAPQDETEEEREVRLAANAERLRLKAEHDAALEAEEQKVSFLHENASQGGLAAALARAKQMGLGQTTQKLVGRANDAKGAKIVEKMVEIGQAPPDRRSRVDKDYDFSHIQIVHRNDRGEAMTQREAFRHLSHYMHGTFPSQNKQEKEHRKRQIELKRETMPMGDTPLHTVQKSADAMKRSGQAFVELDTKHKLSASDFTAAKQKLAAIAEGPNAKKAKTH